MTTKEQQLINKFLEPKLTYLEVRELQYLIKEKYGNADKQKYFSIINIYKLDNNNYLKTYLRNLLIKLKSV